MTLSIHIKNYQLKKISMTKNIVESSEAHAKKVALVEAYFRKLKCPDYDKKAEKVN